MIDQTQAMLQALQFFVVGVLAGMPFGYALGMRNAKRLLRQLSAEHDAAFQDFKRAVTITLEQLVAQKRD